MDKEELSPELEKIFDEYENYFWNTLCECRDCDIEEAVEIFRDALVDIDKIMKEKEMLDDNTMSETMREEAYEWVRREPELFRC